MTFQKLSQGGRTVPLWHGGPVIETWSCFTLKQIHIHVPGGEKEEKKKENYTCLCNECLTVGRIVAIGDGDPGGIYLDKYDATKNWTLFPTYYYCHELTVYDVELCVELNEFVLVENCMATDHTPHQIDEVVICIVQQALGDPLTLAYDTCYNTPGCELGDCPEPTGYGIFYRIAPMGNLPEGLVDFDEMLAAESQ